MILGLTAEQFYRQPITFEIIMMLVFLTIPVAFEMTAFYFFFKSKMQGETNRKQLLEMLIVVGLTNFGSFFIGYVLYQFILVLVFL